MVVFFLDSNTKTCCLKKSKTYILLIFALCKTQMGYFSLCGYYGKWLTLVSVLKICWNNAAPTHTRICATFAAIHFIRNIIRGILVKVSLSTNLGYPQNFLCLCGQSSLALPGNCFAAWTWNQPRDSLFILYSSRSLNNKLQHRQCCVKHLLPVFLKQYTSFIIIFFKHPKNVSSYNEIEGECIKQVISMHGTWTRDWVNQVLFLACKHMCVQEKSCSNSVKPMGVFGVGVEGCSGCII